MPFPLASALAHRIARVLRLSAVALPAGAAACGGNVILDGMAGSTGSGTGGAGGAPSVSVGAGGFSATSGGVGGAGVACIMGPPCTPDGPNPLSSEMECFAPPPGAPCPDAANAQSFFMHGCGAVTAVQEACIGGPPGECCYNVSQECLCVGRPFLVDGAPETAPAVPGGAGGWWREGAIDAADLPPEVRDALAAAFTRDGLGEHASVASFGRFALELLAVGAPAELVAAAHGAALDEVRHAQIAFGLASAFGGAPVGPGAFPVREVALRGDLVSFARALIAEGCVGETAAALVAAERAAAATDARVAEALAAIAEDEARHAELAWRTAAWALGAGGAEVAEAIFAAFDEAVARLPSAPGGAADRLRCAPAGAADRLRCAPAGAAGMDLRAFGVLDAQATAAIARAAAAEIVGPSVRALATRRGLAGELRGELGPRAPGRTFAIERAFG